MPGTQWGSPLLSERAHEMVMCGWHPSWMWAAILDLIRENGQSHLNTILVLMFSWSVEMWASSLLLQAGASSASLPSLMWWTVNPELWIIPQVASCYIGGRSHKKRHSCSIEKLLWTPSPQALKDHTLEPTTVLEGTGMPTNWDLCGGLRVAKQQFPIKAHRSDPRTSVANYCP